MLTDPITVTVTMHFWVTWLRFFPVIAMAKAPVEVEVDLAVSSAGFAPVSVMFIDVMLEVTVPVAPLKLVVVRHLGSTVPVNSLAGVTVIASLPAPP